jgi:diguanylate cyclase (GGDEF)-like protein/PAS domain S-box-containing protein
VSDKPLPIPPAGEADCPVTSIVEDTTQPIRLPPAAAGPPLDLDASVYENILDRMEDGVYFVDSNKRIRLWNGGAEALTGFSRGEVVGRVCGEQGLCHVDANGNRLCETGCPLDLVIKTQAPYENDAYLQHRLGHRIPVRIRTLPLRDREGRVVGAVEVFRNTMTGRRQDQLIEELSHLALIDDLTRLPNRRHFDIQLDRRLAELNRFDWPFGVLMIDLDHFKEINDRYGHHVGDRVLHMVARTLSANLRSLDTIARWGGEEFSAIIANVREDELGKVAEKLRAMVEASGLRESSDVPERVTVSIGGVLARTNEPAAELMKRADEMMYAAKRTGRNRVCI